METNSEAATIPDKDFSEDEIDIEEIEEDEESFEEITNDPSVKNTRPNIDEMDFETCEEPPKLPPKKQTLLDDWKKVTKYGKVVEGTNILPMKTPMHTKRWTKHTNKEDQFNLLQLIRELKEKGEKVGAVVDLNLSDGGYYSWDYLFRKNKELLMGIEYRKIKMNAKELPTKSNLNKVYDVLNKNFFKKHLVLIHCTKGINRTGHSICYFLCQRFQMKPDEVLKKFEAARGYPVCTKELLDDLHDRFD